MAEVYLDFNATTPADPRVVEAMRPFFSERFANPASAHPGGRRVAAAVEEAREQVAALVGAQAGEVVFTSGATEAANLVLAGLAEAAPPRRRRVLVASTEHKAVLEPADRLASRGFVVERVPVDGCGVVDLDVLASRLAGDVLVVAVMAASNETGTLGPLREVGGLAERAGAVFFTDATQQAGRLLFEMGEVGADAVALSGHKLYGPKGVGAVVVRRGVRRRLVPLLVGGGHEGGVRAGTLNAPGIVGFGTACSLAADSMETDAVRQARLRDRLHALLAERVSGVVLNGHPRLRLPNTLNLRFVGADGEAVLANMPGVAASTGSACASAAPGHSHVLAAMGMDTEAASESIRFSLGRTTGDTDIDLAAESTVRAVERVRELTEAGAVAAA